MRAKLPHGTLDKLWSDPVNWHGLGFYYCKDDPRTIVPKRIKWTGWTINFAHKAAWISFLGEVFVAYIPSVLLVKYGIGWLALLWVAVVLFVTLLTGRAKSAAEKYEEP